MLILIAVVFGTGCAGTFQEVKPVGLAVSPPKEKPALLVFGEIKINDDLMSKPEQQVMALAFQMGVEQWCAEHDAFIISPPNTAHNTIVLNGTIYEINAGTAKKRILIVWHPKARIAGTFAIDASDGKNFASFTACQSHLLRTGFVPVYISTEAMMEELGQLVAETANKWARGEIIQ